MAPIAIEKQQQQQQQQQLVVRERRRQHEDALKLAHLKVASLEKACNEATRVADYVKDVSLMNPEVYGNSEHTECQVNSLLDRETFEWLADDPNAALRQVLSGFYVYKSRYIRSVGSLPAGHERVSDRVDLCIGIHGQGCVAPHLRNKVR